MMPNMVKSAMVQKFAEDKEVYSTMHRLFGLENILAALKPTTPVISAVQKPAVEIITEGSDMDNATIRAILDKGYALKGEQVTERVAVLANDYSQLGPLHRIGGSDVGSDYDLVMRTGEIRSGFVPKRSRGAPKVAALLHGYGGSDAASLFVLFGNGDYAITGDALARGEMCNKKLVARDYFANTVATTPKGITSGSKFTMFTPDLELIGAYRASQVIETVHGMTVKAYSLLPGESYVTINAYRNCKTVDAASNKEEIFVPINTLCGLLNKEVTSDLEVNVNSAIAKLELNTLTALGSAVNMGFDGIEFTYNGKPVGSEIKMIEVLVGHEGIAPDKAESFIKQAKEQRQIKIYMSKKAEDFQPAEVPQFGELPAEQENNFGADKDGAFTNNLRAASDTQDAQTMESMVISELLQATDMSGLVKEYLPDIENAIDKLGRTLFLARLNMDKLSQSQNPNEVMSFIANLRNVYRLLGDNVTKLERMVSGPEEAQEEAGSAK
jgi:hypothetical protein